MFHPTEHQRQTAFMLFGLGATDKQVGRHLGISHSTVALAFAEEREFGWDMANLKLYGKLWEKAVVKGDIAALIFLAKNRLGMRDRFEQHSTGDAPPIRAELGLRVEYRYPDSPRARAPPPAERLPQLAPPEKKAA